MSDDKEKERQLLREKYRSRGFQTMSLAEYEVLRAKKEKGLLKLKIPTHLKFILGTPFIILFCCGILFIPYILYLIATGPEAEPKERKKHSSYDAIFLKKDK